MTRELSITREAAADWLILQDAQPDGLDVFSVVARRRVDETIASVAAEVCSVVDAALEGFQISLLYLENEWKFVNRLDSLLQRRNQLWTTLENRGTELPTGARSEWNISMEPDRNRFFGVIRLGSGELASALELARSNDAVCVASRTSIADDRWREVVPHALAQEAHQHGRGAMLRAVITDLPNGALVMRAYGEFDDVEIAVDVVGESSSIDELEVALTEAAR